MILVLILGWTRLKREAEMLQGEKEEQKDR